MDSLKEKIKQTELFTPLEKVDLLAGFERLSADQRKNLEDVINEFDRKHNALVHTFKMETLKDLDQVVKSSSSTSREPIRHAVQQMRKGLHELFPDESPSTA